jgi:hypothetical protein
MREFRRFAIFIALVIALRPGFASADDGAPPVLTVCEALSDLQKYEGRSVIVAGRFSSTEEGSWLDEECGRKVVNGGREFPAAISLAYVVSEFAAPPPIPPGFKWQMPVLLQKLEQVRATTGLRVIKAAHYSDKWMAVFGRLETHLPRQIRPNATTNGFGHLSSAPAQLISPKDGYRRLSAR